MLSNKNYEFIVTKRSYMYSDCSECDGTGVKKRSFRKMVFIEDCTDCKGEGRKRYAITEEFSLAEAMKELKLNV